MKACGTIEAGGAEKVSVVSVGANGGRTRFSGLEMLVFSSSDVTDALKGGNDGSSYDILRFLCDLENGI